MPVTYVDTETGEVFNKKQLKTKLFKRNGTDKFEQTEPWGTTYVHTIVRIENVREKPIQQSLFGDA